MALGAIDLIGVVPGRIAGAMRALLARHDEKEEAELYPLAQAR